MPLIQVYFKDTKATREVLKSNGLKICEVVAEILHYELSEIVLIPRPMSEGNLEISVNTLPIDFVIDVGQRAIGQVKLLTPKLVHRFRTECGLSKIHFGVWLRPFRDSMFAENDPTK